MPRKTNLCGKSTRFHSWHGPARFGPRPAAGRTRAVGGRAQRCGRAAEGAPRGPCLRGVISSFLAASRRTTRAQHSVRAVCRSVFAASAGLSEGEALTEACPHAQPLCDALERALSHGLGKTRVWTFWAFAKRVRNLGSGTARRVADVASVKWITTDHGRTRALIRRCLNAGTVRELMQDCTRDPRAVTECYTSRAVMRDGERLSVLVSVVAGLDAVPFQLEWDSARQDHHVLGPAPGTGAAAGAAAAAASGRPRTQSEVNELALFARATSDGLTSLVRGLGTAVQAAAQWVAEELPRGSNGANVIGRPLEEVVGDPRYAARASLDPELATPDVVEAALAVLEARKNVRGTWKRVASQADTAQAVEAVVTLGQLPDGTSAAEALGALILFLGALPSPLVPSEAAEALAKAVARGPEDSENVAELLASSPPRHRATLRSVLRRAANTCDPASVAMRGAGGGSPFADVARALGPPLMHPKRTLLSRALRQLPPAPPEPGPRATPEARSQWHAQHARRARQAESLAAEEAVRVVEALLANVDACLEALDRELARAEERLAAKTQALEQLRARLGTSLDPEQPEHVARLRELWVAMHSAAALEVGVATPEVDEVQLDDEEGGGERSGNGAPPPFALRSPVWQTFGFQRDEPASDLRGGGMLAVDQLLYLASAHRAEVSRIIRRMRRADALHHFPLAAAGVNVTRMIAEAAGIALRGGQRTPAFDAAHASRQPLWAIAHRPHFADRLYSEASLLLEATWRAEGSTYLTFNRVLKNVRESLWREARAHGDSLDDLCLGLRERSEATRRRADANATLVAVAPAPARCGAFLLSLPPIPPPLTPGSTSAASDSSYVDVGAANEEEEEEEEEEEGPCGEGMDPLRVQSSTLLTHAQVASLCAELPEGQRGYEWELLYRLGKHGASFETLLRRVTGEARTVLVLRDRHGIVFGGYAAGAWRRGAHYTGSGESFLFSFWNGEEGEAAANTESPTVYRWTGENDFVLLCTDEGLAMGGGGGFGLYLDSDLTQGTSGHCATFDSRPLVPGGDFTCTELEMWGFRLQVDLG